VFLSTEYKKCAEVFTVIQLQTYIKIESCLPVHNATLVQKADSQNNFGFGALQL
jgi:hypothetical protein